MQKRKIEEKINNVICKYYKNWVGKGPKYIKTRVFEDIAVIKFARYQMPLYDHVLQNKDGKELLSNMSARMFNFCKHELIKKINSIVDTDVKNLYFDSEKIEGEMVLTIVFKDEII